MDYCARVFGARGAYSHHDLDAFELPDRFDLAWCGSLVTHLDAARIAALLWWSLATCDPAASSSSRRTAGARSSAWSPAVGSTSYPAPDRVAAVAARGERVRIHTLPRQIDYGISITSAAWLRRLWGPGSGWREVPFAEHRWDDHEDVYGLVKTGD